MPLHVYYDTRLAPVTFDFATFLVHANAHCHLIGATSIYLNLVAPKFRLMSTRDRGYEDSEKRWRLHHILGQLPRVLPSVMRTTVQHDTISQISFPSFPPDYPPKSGEQAKLSYLAHYVVKYYQSGLDVQPFRSSTHAKQLVQSAVQSTSYMTISLRTSQFQEARNSNLDEWYKVYRYLTERGKSVFVIPDFEDTMSSRLAMQYDWNVAEFAMHDIDLRLALYEGAEENFAVNNGTSSLLFFSQCPFKLFKLVTPGIKATVPESIQETWLTKPGETPEIFKENQKWIWEDDTFENIIQHVGV